MGWMEWSNTSSFGPHSLFTGGHNTKQSQHRQDACRITSVVATVCSVSNLSFFPQFCLYHFMCQTTSFDIQVKVLVEVDRYSFHTHLQSQAYAYLEHKICTFKIYPDFVSCIGLAYSGLQPDHLCNPNLWMQM